MKQTTPFYLRAGLNPKDPSSCSNFLLDDKECTLIVNAKGQIKVHKNHINNNGFSKHPIATGKFVATKSKIEGVPALRAVLTTPKGDSYKLAAWLHEDDNDEYYVVRYDAYERKGKLFSIN